MQLLTLKLSAAASTRHSGHSPLLLRAFKPAVCQAFKPLKPVKPLIDPKRLRGSFVQLLTLKLSAAASTGSFDQALRPQPSVVKGVQACRLPRPQRPKTLRGRLRRPQPSVVKFARLQMLHSHPRQLRRAFKDAPKTLRGSFDQALRPQLSATIGVRGCRLHAFNGLNRSAAASTRHAGHSHLLLSAFEAAVSPPSKA